MEGSDHPSDKPEVPLPPGPKSASERCVSGTPREQLGDSSDSDKQLIDALRNFIKAVGAPAPQTTPQINVWDGIWLLLAFGCVSLALSLVPEHVYSSEWIKSVIEKASPWFLNVGAIAAILRSPEAVLSATRRSRVRWSVAVLFVLLALASYPMFITRPVIIGGGTAFIDGKAQPSEFRLRFRDYDIELRSPIGVSRLLAFGMKDMLHGLTLRPEWRAVYSVELDSSDDQIAACFQPQFDLRPEDRELLSRQQFRNIGKRAFELYFANAGGLSLDLPAGSYDVIGFKYDCGLTPTLRLDVGLEADKRYTLRRAKCANAPVLPVRPCDRLLGEGKKDTQ